MKRSIPEQIEPGPFSCYLTLLMIEILLTHLAAKYIVRVRGVQ
jgi:hypothetical protein